MVALQEGVSQLWSEDLISINEKNNTQLHLAEGLDTYDGLMSISSKTEPEESQFPRRAGHIPSACTIRRRKGKADTFKSLWNSDQHLRCGCLCASYILKVTSWKSFSNDLT
ncbi:uncharacterized protein O3C94_017510 [Discoglossus pictus]